MKQYYRTINTNNSFSYWHGDNERATWLLKTNKLVLPLGTRKPKNVSRETIREF